MPASSKRAEGRRSCRWYWQVQERSPDRDSCLRQSRLRAVLLQVFLTGAGPAPRTWRYHDSGFHPELKFRPRAWTGYSAWY